MYHNGKTFIRPSTIGPFRPHNKMVEGSGQGPASEQSHVHQNQVQELHRVHKTIENLRQEIKELEDQLHVLSEKRDKATQQPNQMAYATFILHDGPTFEKLQGDLDDF